jgi:hypothetical protein
MSTAGAKSVKVGLFSGARTSKNAPAGETGEMSGDSLNLNEYISYVLLAAGALSNQVLPVATRPR